LTDSLERQLGGNGPASLYSGHRREHHWRCHGLGLRCALGLPLLITAVFRSLLAIRHLLEMYPRRLSDEKPRRKIARLEQRLLKISAELKQLVNPQE
jgi:hypothetical protein